ncbi:hypothetical protein Enr10x_52270 [Gimesia panareensis]|uniref:Uncharacterized protein n=1 Tax=Gimesia panareensis TaxID=2527978 RepID=A0A517QE11_9PLAN|nr:hypothetical protein [Gimesia panareensis]QDT29870.1 hypothetical protein Enr10x_52270 [Gimesia panareensis]|tara:strand:- start:748 stop:963 length:216 start_codon:yes stop_codon:yes gene_type:complete
MKQSDLNRAVALATGETIATVKRLGFLLAEPQETVDPDSETSGPLVIDWDELENQRMITQAEGLNHVPSLV